MDFKKLFRVKAPRSSIQVNEYSGPWYHQLPMILEIRSFHGFVIMGIHDSLGIWKDLELWEYLMTPHLANCMHESVCLCTFFGPLAHSDMLRSVYVPYKSSITPNPSRRVRIRRHDIRIIRFRSLDLILRMSCHRYCCRPEDEAVTYVRTCSCICIGRRR